MYRLFVLISLVLALNGCSTYVNNNAKIKHSETVHFVVNNLDNGEVMKWYDNPTSSNGSVKVLTTHSFSGKVCRLINSQIYTVHASKNFSEYACTNNNGRTWKFHPQ